MRTFFNLRRKKRDLAILDERSLIWNLKFKRGSIWMPRNFIAGVEELAETRDNLKISEGSGMATLLLLKFIDMLTLLDRTSALLVNRINLVLSGCKASLCDLKKSVTFLNSILTLVMRLASAEWESKG